MLSDLKEKKETFFYYKQQNFLKPSSHIFSKGFNPGF